MKKQHEDEAPRQEKKLTMEIIQQAMEETDLDPEALFEATAPTQEEWARVQAWASRKVSV